MKVKAYQKSLVMDGRNKKLLIFNMSNDDQELKKVDMPIHHIQIIDRSGSMYSHIDELIDHVKDTISHMKDSDYYSVIWFSSHNEYGTILKGVPASAAKDGTNKILDSIRSVMGCTCFSDPINEASKIVNEMKAINDNVSITLFTDGCPVCPWSTEKEEMLVSKLITGMKDDIIAFNTIGYGNYYNKKNLIEWASISQYGEFTHASKIKDYLEIFDSNYEKVSNFTNTPIDFEIESTGDVYYITNSTISHHDKSVHLRYSDKSKNQFVVITDSFLPLIRINGKEFRDTYGEVQDKWMTSIMYKIAYHEYYVGNRDKSLEILCSILGDKNLVDDHFQSFTPNEVGSHTAKLKKAAFKTSFRNPNTCDAKYLPDPNAPCVMNLLNYLVSCPETVYYDYGAHEYNRIGRKVTDEFNMFHKIDKQPLCEIKDVVFSEKKLNVSIRFKILGYVSINPKQAEKVGLPSEYPSHIYRTHTIVKDGFLNMNTIELVMPVSVLNTILLSFPSDAFRTEKIDESFCRVRVDLDKMPIINKSYSDIKTDDVFDMVYNLTKLEAEMKVLRYFIGDKYVDSDTSQIYSDWKSRDLTDEQIQLLEEYGIRKDGTYNGIKNVTPKVEDSDYYISRTLEFGIKGFSTLKPVRDVQKMIDDNCVPNSQKFMAKAIDNVKNMSDFDRKKLMYFDKNTANSIRCILASSKIAKVLTGSWYEDLKAGTKDGQFSYEKDGYTLIVKTAREKTYF